MGLSSCLCPGESSGPPAWSPHMWIHTETAHSPDAIRKTIALQGYVAMQLRSAFTLFIISPAKQQPLCSQNPGWTLI